MVDDILTVTSVENTAFMNESVNTFIEHKRLTLSDKKCHRIHIGKCHRIHFGKEHKNCPNLKSMTK